MHRLNPRARSGAPGLALRCGPGESGRTSSEGDLVYLLATGRARYFWAARLAIDSVRRFGGFSGPIMVVSDRPWRAPHGAEVRVLPAARLRLPYIPKSAIRDVTPLEDWATVTFLDADVLVRAPLAPWIERAREGRMVAADDMGNRVGEGWCEACLTPDERRDAADAPGINAGFFSARGDRLGAFFDAWQAVVERNRPPGGTGYDQPALNAAVVRGLVPAEVHRGAMWFPRWHPQLGTGAAREAAARASFVHFNGVCFPGQLGRMAVHWLKLVIVPSARRSAFSLPRSETPGQR